MALGVGVLFPPGADGRPCAMYVADLRAACPACGYGCVRRYYLSARFHSLTLARLGQLLHDARYAMDGECEQCDEVLDGDAVERWSLMISPGDGSGLLHGLETEDGEVSWRVYPHEFLDVQSLPRFEHAEDQSAVDLDALDEREIFACLSRYWSPKSALRRLIVAISSDAWSDVPASRVDGAGAFRISPADGLDLWIGPNALGEAEEATIDESQSAWSLLVEDGELADGWPDAPARWLRDLVGPLRGRDVIAVASLDAVEAALRTHFDRFPVDLRYEREGSMLRVIAGAGDTPTSRLEFALDEIAEEAARTCSSPGDIARVELDRALVMLDLARPHLDEVVAGARVER